MGLPYLPCIMLWRVMVYGVVMRTARLLCRKLGCPFSYSISLAIFVGLGVVPGLCCKINYLSDERWRCGFRLVRAVVVSLCNTSFGDACSVEATLCIFSVVLFAALGGGAGTCCGGNKCSNSSSCWDWSKISLWRITLCLTQAGAFTIFDSKG